MAFCWVCNETNCWAKMNRYANALLMDKIDPPIEAFLAEPPRHTDIEVLGVPALVANNSDAD